MLDNPSFLVYLWSIYPNITNLVGGILGASLCVLLAVLVASLFVTIDGNATALTNLWKSVYVKLLFTVIGITMLVRTLLPPADHLIFIIAATPAADIIKASYADGKLRKLDQLVDKSLDQALKLLDSNVTK